VKVGELSSSVTLDVKKVPGTGSGGNISVVSSGTITLDGGVDTVSDKSHPGGNMLFVAGAHFNYTGSQIAITSESTTGGNISGSESWLSDGSTRGNLTAVAFNGLPGAPGTGAIAPAPVSAGNALLIAGGKDASAGITVPVQYSLSGNLTLATTKPKLVGGSVTISVSSGDVASGSFAIDTNNIQGGGITLAGATVSQSTIRANCHVY